MIYFEGENVKSHVVAGQKKKDVSESIILEELRSQYSGQSSSLGFIKQNETTTKQ